MKSASFKMCVAAAAVLAGLALAVQAQPVPDANVPDTPAGLRDKQRAEINLQRAEIEARKSEAEKACWQRFAVEKCLREARTQAHAQERALHQQELKLNSEERQEKAAARLRAIEQKQREKQVPAPMTSATKSAKPATQPATGAPRKTEADVAQEQQLRRTAAQQRAAEQQRREQAHAAEQAERATKGEAERAQRQQALRDKQQAAQERRARTPEKRKGAPLPVPEGLPAAQ